MTSISKRNNSQQQPRLTTRTIISFLYVAFTLVGCTLAAAEEQGPARFVDDHASTGGEDVIRTQTKPLHYTDEEDEDILASLAMNLDHQDEMTQFISSAVNSKRASLRGTATPNHSSSDDETETVFVKAAAAAAGDLSLEEDYLTSLAMANDFVVSSGVESSTSSKPLRIQLTIHNGQQLEEPEEDELISLATAAASTRDEMNEMLRQITKNDLVPEIATSRQRLLLRTISTQKNLIEEDDLTSLANSGVATTKEEMKQVLRSL